jgi:aspartate/methionine/tyrosine aminotransferase
MLMLDNSSFLARSFAAVGADVWAAAEPIGSADVIDLTMADPDLPTPEPIVERAVAAPEFADGVYISPSGMVHVWRDGELDGIF